MEKHEIETKLNKVERDLADIARRAHIAASNLRSVVKCGGLQEFAAMSLAQYSDDIENIEGCARLTQKALVKTRELMSRAQGASLASETKSEDTKKGESEQ